MSKKSDLVKKIALEQGLNPKKLHTLPIEELEKMDKVVPDEPSDAELDDALSSDEPVHVEEVDVEAEKAAAEAALKKAEEEQDSDPEEFEAAMGREPRFLGYDVITKEKVYG